MQGWHWLRPWGAPTKARTTLEQKDDLRDVRIGATLEQQDDMRCVNIGQDGINIGAKLCNIGNNLETKWKQY